MKNKEYIESLRIQIDEICHESLEYFVNSIPLDKANFPIMQITYTLWRNQAYRKFTLLKEEVKQVSYKSSQQIQRECIRQFYLKSQKAYLPSFIKRIENQMNIYCKGLEAIADDVKRAESLIDKEQQSYKTIIDLGKAVWLQQLYLELIEDLSKLPYLKIFPPNSSLYAKREYSTNDLFYRTKQPKLKQIANKTGKNIFNKVVTGVSSAIFTKTMLLRINTLFGAFNPLAMGATFGVSQYLEYLNRKGEQAKVQMEFKIALEFITDKTNKMKEVYRQILNLIGDLTNQVGMKEKQQISQKIKHLFLTIFEEPWLKVQQKVDSQGWTDVKFQELEQFQDLISEEKI